MLSKSNRELINSLKGRVSKVLNVKSTLKLEERSGLEGIYAAIDELILSNKEDSDILTFRDELELHSKFLKGTKKTYIKDHIIPIINKVSNKGWGKDG
jgi:hypothetical protein